MHRRSFLKACGISGLLYATNWTTFICGPQLGDRVIRGFIKREFSSFHIAGENLEAGDLVARGSDGRVYKMTLNRMDATLGIAGATAEAKQPLEVVIQGSMTLRT